MLTQDRLSKPRNRLKRIRVFLRSIEGVSLARREAALKRSPLQQQMMEFLVQHGESDTVLIKKFLGNNIYPSLRGLLKKGLVDVEEREVSSDPFLAPCHTGTGPCFDHGTDAGDGTDLTRSSVQIFFSPFCCMESLVAAKQKYTSS